MTLKRYRKLSFAFTLAVILVLAPSTWAQSFRGSIRGKVTDPSGSTIAGATVSAQNTGTGLVRKATTGDDGGYVLAELPAGVYTVTATAAGLSPAAQNIQVNVGLDTTANFDLTKVEKRQEQLNVTAEAPLIDTTRDVLGEIVEQRLVTELPLNGRDFGKLVALVPGATVEPSGVAGTQFGFGQFNINGNRDRSNNYSLDGTDNNDPYFNNSALNQVGITGAPASLLPIDAVQEFNLQSQFGAEYGRNSGSVVNILTRSGSNQLHGSAFGFFRNSALDARNFFNTEQRKTSFHNSQFGASFGGPVIKDKTFFFGAYEGQRERVGSDFLLQVPTVAQRNAARQIALDSGLLENGINPGLETLLDFYPVSDTPFIPGVVRDKNDMDSLIVKLDHNFTSTQQITGRYAFARSAQIFPLGSAGGFGDGSRLAPFANTSPTRVQVVSLSFLSTLSSTRINEVRFGYSRYRTSFSSLDINSGFDPASIGLDFGTGKLGVPEIDFSAPIENLGAQGFSIPRGRTSQTYQILDNFTWVRGHHTLKFGGEFRRAAIDNFNDNLERGIINFFPVGLDEDPVVDTLANYYLGGAPDGNFFVLALTGDTHRTTYNNGFSFFAQDDFRVRPNFTLNFGVRWEYFGPLSEKNNLLSNIGRDGQLAMVGTDGLNGAFNRDLNNFAPRVGFAWNVREHTVVRGAYGVYYDYIPQHLMLANFTPSAGIATNPIGPKPVTALNFNSDPFNGNSTGPIYTLASAPYNIFVTPRNFATPYVQNWNLNVQHSLNRAAALELGYVGSKGTRLVRLYDQNQADADFNFPNPNYANMHTLATISSSTYHAMQATFRMNEWAGFSGFTSYTWSKSLDDASDGIDFTAGAAFPQDSTNLKAEYGPSTFDTRHRFTAAINYRVPTWGPQRLGEGWALNTIITAQSGRPIPIVTSDDTSGRFYFNQRPNVVPGVNPIVSNWTPATGYLNTAAFSQPDFGTFGNLGRDSIYGPRYWNIDFSVSKNTMITDRLGVQLRAEFFNIFNHPNFALPGGAIVSPGDTSVQNGFITQTPDVAQGNPGLGGGGPRVLQLGLKLVF
ncbi:MAG: TonB-dependent receptor [Acidobacteria bacterium]|nr:TonB-dependent receptor [Acidobacteriota bacterium]